VETPPALILVGGLATFTSLEDNTLPTGTALLLVVIDSDDRGHDMRMGLKPGIHAAAFVAVFVSTGCSAGRDTSCRCPKPVAYDEATLKKISQALRALPADNILQRAMEDYENERDDLRFCR
jgi:hypothetical protein